ncbi:MAG: Crp/Fnr family transcriptional regulator [Wenzhouxiangella sp.]
MNGFSCIAGQFEQLASLDKHQINLLESLEQDIRKFPAGSMICEAGAEANSLYILHEGWACATRLLADGQRQVLDIFLPGQVMGLREIGFKRFQSDVVSLTEVEACQFSRARLLEVFSESPRLADLFFLSMAREQAMFGERIVSIGRRPAAERLGHFLLELKTRLLLDSKEFELPLNQSVIGDALGLSAVHVSRTLGVLRERNLVRVEKRRVSITDLEGLVDFSGFDRAYLDCSSNWARLN